MIRILREEDAEAYAELRREALLDSPLAFTSSPADDLAFSPHPPDSVILGAFDRSLVGAVGAYRDRHVKASHRVHVWGMYVTPSHRGKGIAAELMRGVIEHARSLPGVSWVLLSVSSAAPGARSLYERLGFQVWGTEPDALRYEGRSVVENHMALKL
jgi:ribosomal protein S18 acetylase RimI-like enzyme